MEGILDATGRAALYIPVDKRRRQEERQQVREVPKGAGICSCIDEENAVDGLWVVAVFCEASTLKLVLVGPVLEETWRPPCLARRLARFPLPKNTLIKRFIIAKDRKWDVHVINARR